MHALLILLDYMQVHVLHQGYLRARAIDMIKGLNGRDIQLKYRVDSGGYIRLSLHGLLLIKENSVVIIDPGCADFLPARVMKEYGLEVTESIEYILLKKGVEAGQVTDVIFTHLHFDHGSGAFKREPGKISKRFTNARYHVLKEHFEYASRPHPSESNSFFTLFFKYIDTIHWLEDWSFDWMKFRIFNGHTRGMAIPEIKSGQEKIFFLSDLLPMEVFLQKEVYSGYDLDPDLARSEKLEFLSEFSESSRFILFHDPFIDSMYYP